MPKIEGQNRMAVLVTLPEKWDLCDVALWFEMRLAELKRNQSGLSDDAALPILDDCKVFIAEGTHVDEFSERVQKEHQEAMARGEGHT